MEKNRNIHDTYNWELYTKLGLQFSFVNNFWKIAIIERNVWEFEGSSNSSDRIVKINIHLHFFGLC